MDITLFYFQDCPNWRTVPERLTVLAAERSDITVTHQLVETLSWPNGSGSWVRPSIQVDGVDVFAGPGSRVGLACRRYLTPDGYAGAPTLEQLRAVLADA